MFPVVVAGATTLTCTGRPTGGPREAMHRPHQDTRTVVAGSAGTLALALHRRGHEVALYTSGDPAGLGKTPLVAADGRTQLSPCASGITTAEFRRLLASERPRPRLLVADSSDFLRPLLAAPGPLPVPLAADLREAGGIDDLANQPGLDSATIVCVHREQLPVPPRAWMARVFGNRRSGAAVLAVVTSDDVLIGLRDGRLGHVLKVPAGGNGAARREDTEILADVLSLWCRGEDLLMTMCWSRVWRWDREEATHLAS
jgi:hypothetical protein